MDAYFEGRPSDSPYIEMIWRGHAEHFYAPVCPADERWNLLLLRKYGRVQVFVEGPATKATWKTHVEGTEWSGIKFKLGVFMPILPVGNLLDGAAVLPEASSKSFWLHGAAWQFPDYDNVETFVERLVGEGLLVRDPVVGAVLQDEPLAMSARTLRRRFLRATGLTPKTIQQIERARHAVALLEQGVPLLDAAYQAGYADQPHMTRSLKYFVGRTPAQIARVSTPE